MATAGTIGRAHRTGLAAAAPPPPLPGAAGAGCLVPPPLHASPPSPPCRCPFGRLGKNCEVDFLNPCRPAPDWLRECYSALRWNVPRPLAVHVHVRDAARLSLCLFWCVDDPLLPMLPAANCGAIHTKSCECLRRCQAYFCRKDSNGTELCSEWGCRCCACASPPPMMPKVAAGQLVRGLCLEASRRTAVPSRAAAARLRQAHTRLGAAAPCPH